MAEQIDFSTLLEKLTLIEVAGCKCILNSCEFFVVIVYFPGTPTLNELNVFTDYFEENFLNFNNVILLGDFNIPNYVLNPSDNSVLTIAAFMNILNLKQYNNVLNANGRLLDLVFSDLNCLVSRDDRPLVPEDQHHPPLSIEFTLHTTIHSFLPKNPLRKSLNFKKANFVDLYAELLDTSWSELHDIDNTNQLCDRFYTKLYCILEKHVPIYHKRNRNYSVWYTPEIIANIKEKESAHRRYKRHSRPNDLENFKLLRSLIKQQIKIAYSSYIRDIQETVSTDPNKFWSYVNDRNSKSRIPPKVMFNDSEFADPQLIVDTFAGYFKSTYTNAKFSFNQDDIVSNIPTLNITKICDTDVISAIKKLKSNLTAGVDNIPSFFVKDCSSALTEPLLLIFNSSLKSGIFPDKWKLAKVCPILKSGNASDVTNYRAISIICNFAKVFEIILYTQIYTHVRSFLSPTQHGFVEQRSTITNLAHFSQYTAEALDILGQVDTIYIDFSKAFDQINHDLILSKLHLFGLGESLCTFLKSFLVGRSQSVYLNGFQSFQYEITSGVPQGSNLGPLLFLIFINDLPSTVTNCEILLYADDVKIFKTIKSADDALVLQSCFNQIVDWSASNKLAINCQKCKVVSYSRKKTKFHFDYLMNNVPLERCEKIKDLGIYFDSQFNFNYHVQQILSSSSSSLGFIMRNAKPFDSIAACVSLYKAFVLSRLEYGSIIWSPFYECHKSLLENVQRKFLKFLWFKVNKSYPPRGFKHLTLLNTFDFVSLEQRRTISSLMFLFKLINAKIDCAWLLSKLHFIVPQKSIRKNAALRTDCAKTNIIIRSPIWSMSFNYNKITQEVDIFNLSFSAFKSTVNHIIRSQNS